MGAYTPLIVRVFGSICMSPSSPRKVSEPLAMSRIVTIGMFDPTTFAVSTVSSLRGMSAL